VRHAFRLPSRFRGGIGVRYDSRRTLRDRQDRIISARPDPLASKDQCNAKRRVRAFRSVMRIYLQTRANFWGRNGRQSLTFGIDPSSWSVPRSVVELAVHVFLELV
jgi:hypothetical protein